MAGFGHVRRRCATVAALAALTAAMLAPPAGADDGPPALGDAIAEASGSVAEAVDIAMGAVATDVSAVEDAPQVDSVLPPELATGSPSPESSVTAEEGEMEAAVGDTGAIDDDIAADTAVGPSEPAGAAHGGRTAAASSEPPATHAPADSPAPAPVQRPPLGAAPANVNVSIRVDSPGDDGPVTQLNVIVAGDAGQQSSAGSASTASAVAPFAGATARPNAGSESMSSAPSMLDWIWGCLTPPSISPAVSEHDTGERSSAGNAQLNQKCIDNLSSEPANLEQYQGEITGPYGPVNINITIRVGSPGNNGPVTQTNVTVRASTTVGTSGRTAASASPVSSEATITVELGAGTDTSPIVVGVSMPNASVVVEDASTLVISPPVLDDPILDDEALELAHGGTRVVSVVFLGSEEDTSPVAVGGLRPTWGRPVVDGAGGLTSDGRAAVLGSSATPSRPTGEGVQQRRRKPTERPSWHAPVPPVVLVGAPLSGASAAAAGATGSPGGALPVFLLFPVIAVMFDLARRVALSRVTWPTGHRARIPDTPG